MLPRLWDPPFGAENADVGRKNRDQHRALAPGIRKGGARSVEPRSAPAPSRGCARDQHNRAPGGILERCSTRAGTIHRAGIRCETLQLFDSIPSFEMFCVECQFVESFGNCIKLHVSVM